ncbi:hypothetical protein BCON_0011g00230 [Botryotinia convoluta]|uniref:Uncharacterized protein n=1 Tax=Botryotinia convoluta TaxID=54673 RepID=A0A4Z1J3N1_9HELO|nr:hypothetical protein BCON_0011g00230 [Botryotinia convoluta]
MRGSGTAMDKMVQAVKGLTVNEAEDQIVIALDFGTTFSGIAYAFAKGGKPDLVSVMDWPGTSFKQPKIPTVICYDPDNKDGFTWGAQKHKTKAVAGVKLLLDPDQPRPLYLPESTAKVDIKRLGKPAVDVAADYIEAIYKHALEKIEGKVPAEYLRICQKQFVLSVPAVWSDKAKDTTLKAAKKAGIHPITLIKEPEAAALYTLHTMVDRSLTVGDALVICDAGGGMAGSLGLNQRFVQAVKELVGEDAYYHLRKTKGFELATKQFDQSIKTSFRGDPDEDYYVNFPMADLEDDPFNGLQSNTWNMKVDDVKVIFDPLISDIERLVSEQVNLVRVKRMQERHAKENEIKAIFLVGGFGASEYLKIRLEKIHPDIQIIQPHDAWSAIAKGAVLSCLPQKAVIVSTQATKHYGVSARPPYDNKIDKGQWKVYDSSTGVYRTDRMTWYIHQGEDLKRNQTLRFGFYYRLPSSYSPSDLIFTNKLLQSENNIAPIHPSPNSTKTNCILTTDLRDINKSCLKRVMGLDRKEYWDLDYDLVVSINDAVMKFSFEIEGKEMGAVEASYD